MTKMEYEKKVLLTEKEYLALIDRFGKDKNSVLQINHYFDTNDFHMNQSGITCRIREKEGKYKAVVKNHRHDKMYCSTETEVQIRNGLVDNDFIEMGLSYQGKLHTFRTVILEADYCKIMLDRNAYLGIVDYELEAEFPADRERDALRTVWEILSTLKVNDGVDVEEPTLRMTSESKSKSERFFERKKKMSAVYDD